MDLDRILKPKEVIDRLKYAEKQCVRGYYYILIRPDVRDRIIELLKKQEAVKPVLDEQTGRIWLCGKCGSYVGFEDNDPHDPNEFDKYCRECGGPVLWEGR